MVIDVERFIDENIRITERGCIDQQDKNILSSSGVKLIEARNPEQPDTVFTTAIIQTTEDKSMPDNYGTHKITVVRYVDR